LQNITKVHKERARECWKKDDNGSRSFEIFYLSVTRSPRAIVSSSFTRILFLFLSLIFLFLFCALERYSLCARDISRECLFTMRPKLRRVWLFFSFLTFLVPCNSYSRNCNFLGISMCRLSCLFNYLLSLENIWKFKDKILSCVRNKNILN